MEEALPPCPSCRAPVPAGTAICPNCDFIIDDTFLSTEPSTDHGTDHGTIAPAEKTVIAPPPSPRSERVRKGRSSSARTRPRQPRPEVNWDKPTQIKSLDEVRAEQDHLSSLPRSPRSPSRRHHRPLNPGASVAGAPPAAGWRARLASVEPGSAEELFQQLREFVRDLSLPDKLAALGGAATVLIAFFPWKETRMEGEVPGIFSLAAPVVLAALLVAAAVVVRVKRIQVPGGPQVPWLVQLVAGGFAVLWCGIFFKLSWNSTQLPALTGKVLVPISAPSWGAYLGLCCLLLSLSGTLMGLKERRH